jgi:hypothetical protein
MCLAYSEVSTLNFIFKSTIAIPQLEGRSSATAYPQLLKGMMLRNCPQPRFLSAFRHFLENCGSATEYPQSIAEVQTTEVAELQTGLRYFRKSQRTNVEDRSIITWLEI